MTIKGKVHCFFEQSGTFKRAFMEFGIPAEDYDIQNNFGETDHQIDLFSEIENGYAGKPSIFDTITPDDLVLAFFPCIRFCNIAEYNQRLAQEKWRRDGMSVPQVWEHLKKAADERHRFYTLALKMHANVEIRGGRLIMENPWNTTNYTNYFWFMKPAIIDTDRTRRGDLFVKPTAYWFLNCKPTHGMTNQQTPRSMRRSTNIGYWSKKPNPNANHAKGSTKVGLCSEERSMISPDYARNFIADFILGKPSDAKPSQLDMFDMIEGAK